MDHVYPVFRMHFCIVIKDSILGACLYDNKAFDLQRMKIAMLLIKILWLYIDKTKNEE